MGLLAHILRGVVWIALWFDIVHIFSFLLRSSPVSSLLPFSHFVGSLLYSQPECPNAAPTTATSSSQLKCNTGYQCWVQHRLSQNVSCIKRKGCSHFGCAPLSSY